jgi:hypothetical protein
MVQAADVVFIADAAAIDRWRSRADLRIETAGTGRATAAVRAVSRRPRRQAEGWLPGRGSGGSGVAATATLDDLVGPRFGHWRTRTWTSGGSSRRGGQAAVQRTRSGTRHVALPAGRGSGRSLPGAGRRGTVGSRGRPGRCSEAGAAGTAVVTSAAQWARLPAEIAAQVGADRGSERATQQIVARASHRSCATGGELACNARCLPDTPTRTGSIACSLTSAGRSGGTAVGVRRGAHQPRARARQRVREHRPPAPPGGGAGRSCCTACG